MYRIIVTYSLTPHRKVLPEKLIGFKLVKKFSAFLDPHSQVPVTCPYPKPAESSPYSHVPLPKGPS
jgi:hypothetical protein